jgi:hypothetical protein
MHHVPMKPHQSIFIMYQWQLISSYQWKLIDPSMYSHQGWSIFIISMTTHWSIYVFSSRVIHLHHINDNSLIHLCILIKDSLIHLCILIKDNTYYITSIINKSITWHQSIKPLASITTWSNNLPLWHWWQYQHWCQRQLPIIDVNM